MTISERELIQKAKEVSLNAYSPYSHFLVQFESFYLSLIAYNNHMVMF